MAAASRLAQTASRSALRGPGRLATLEEVVDWQPYEHFG
jgi:hypothetical protein